jgi:hypothetical protein
MTDGGVSERAGRADIDKDTTARATAENLLRSMGFLGSS